MAIWDYRLLQRVEKLMSLCGFLVSPFHCFFLLDKALVHSCARLKIYTKLVLWNIFIPWHRLLSRHNYLNVSGAGEPMIFPVLMDDRMLSQTVRWEVIRFPQNIYVMLIALILGWCGISCLTYSLPLWFYLFERFPVIQFLFCYPQFWLNSSLAKTWLIICLSQDLLWDCLSMPLNILWASEVKQKFSPKLSEPCF